MQSIEVTAKNIDDARKNAATKLGVTADRLTLTILEESKGLFGKVSLRVRADVTAEEVVEAPEPEAPVVEEAPVVPAAKAPKAAAKVVEPAPAAEEKAGAPRRKLGAKVKAVEDAPVEEAIAEVVEAKPAVKPAARGKKAVEPAPVEAEVAVEGSTEAPAEEESREDDVVATDEDAAKIIMLVNDLLEKSGLTLDVQNSGIQGKYVNLSLDGKDAAYLVGKHGEVINALQYLINLTVKQQMANGVRVVLDGNDYRKRREIALTGLATRIADQVKERGEEAVLDALPAFERRVIHKALSEIEGVVTYSEGEEPNRRVVIAPAE